MENKNLGIPPITQEQKKVLYSLTEEDFYKFPEIISSYKFRDKVTRENFINFLIQSFAVSRGNLGSQIIYFHYLEFKEGFDYKNSFAAFKKGGGFNALSFEEQKIFLDAVDGVKKHLAFGIEKIRGEIERLNDKASDNMYSILNREQEFFDFSAIESLGDFSQAVAKYNRVIHGVQVEKNTEK